jgi:hypothetical protein
MGAGAEGAGAAGAMEANAGGGMMAVAGENMNGAVVAVADGASWAWTATQVGVTALSAYLGGEFGNWVYGGE